MILHICTIKELYSMIRELSHSIKELSNWTRELFYLIMNNFFIKITTLTGENVNRIWELFNSILCHFLFIDNVSLHFFSFVCFLFCLVSFRHVFISFLLEIFIFVLTFLFFARFRFNLFIFCPFSPFFSFSFLFAVYVYPFDTTPIKNSDFETVKMP